MAVFSRKNPDGSFNYYDDLVYRPDYTGGWRGVVPPHEGIATITIGDWTGPVLKKSEDREKALAALRQVLDSKDATTQERLDAARLILEDTKE